MLDKVKLSLRITSNYFDNEITDLIESARQDLVLSGVSSKLAKEQHNIDPLIERAIILYCKANFGYDNSDADRLNHSYEMLKQHLSMAGDYNA